MSNNNYNYSGYYGHHGTTSNQTGNHYPSAVNGYGASNSDYFTSRSDGSNVNERSSAAAYGTNAGYSNRNNYDSTTVGSLAYNNASGNATSRAYASPNPGYSQWTSAQHQNASAAQSAAAYATPVQNSTTSTYTYQTARPDSSASSASVAPQSRAAYNAVSQHQQQPTLDRAHSPQDYKQRNQYYSQPSQGHQATYDNRVQPAQHAGASHVQAVQQRDNRASVETTGSHPSTTNAPEQTVNMTQLYDDTHEWQRRAQKAEAEAEAKRRAEEQQREAARKAEQEKRTAAQASALVTPQNQQQQPTSQTAEVQQDGDTAEKPKKKRAPRKSDGTGSRRGRKKDKEQGTTDKADDVAQAAAMTLLQAANGGGSGNLEDQMREMFKRMREFNALNPDMLSRLWQEERDAHVASEQARTTPAPSQPESASKGPAKASKKSKESARKSNTLSYEKPTPSQTSATPAPVDAGRSRAPIRGPAQGGPNLAPTNTQSQAAAQSQPAPQPPTAVQPQAAAQTSTTTTSAVPQSKGTIWPADKKAALAAAAADLLNSSNPDQQINSQDISALLDKNPSYVELCEQLQGRGLRVDRSKFAKALLSAVPDINRAKPSATPATTTGSSSAAAPVANMQASNEPLKNAEARLLNGESLVATTPSKSPGRPRKDGTSAQPRSGGAKTAKPKTPKENKTPTSAGPSVVDPSVEGLDAVKQFVEYQPGSSAAPKTAKAKANARHRPSITPAPLTKEGQARKRTFSDLVDLTRLSSDDEDLSMLQQPSKRQETQAPLPAIDADEPSHLPTPPPTTAEHPVPGDGEQRFTISDAVYAPARPAQPEVSAPSMPQPSYANGQVTQQTQNQLLQNIVRPQKEQHEREQQTRSAAIPANYPSHTITMAQPLDRYKAIRRSSYNPKTIARDVLLACGRHPDMRHLNAHLEILKQSFTVDNNADLGTFRWDIADPGGPAPGSGAPVPIRQPIDLYNDADDEDDSDNDSVVGGASARRAVRQTVGTDGSVHFEGTPGHGSRRSKGVIGGVKGVRSHTGAGDSGTRRGPGRPRRSEGPTTTSNVASTPGSAGTPSGYTALRAQQANQVDENGNPVKRRGRPVGWRMWMKKGGAGSPAVPTPTKAQPKPPSPRPEYQIYKCEWQDCGAELHNLATLRKHIHKLHGKTDASHNYTCHWSGCGNVTRSSENGRTVSRRTYYTIASLDEWKKHIEKKHLDPIAWQLGDGPASGVSEPSEAEASDAYLSDAQGRRVTPSIVAPKPSSGASSSGPPRSSAHEKALEVERQAAKRKRDIGIGIDKGGARLVNDKRRQGFIDDETEAMIVDDNE